MQLQCNYQIQYELYLTLDLTKQVSEQLQNNAKLHWGDTQIFLGCHGNMTPYW